MNPVRHVPPTPRRSGGRGLVAGFVAVATWVVAGTAAAETPAELLIGGWAAAARASGATVDWARLEPVAGEDRIDLTDLTISVPVAGSEPLRLAVPRLSLVGLAVRGGDGFAVGRLTVPRLTLGTARDGETLAVEVDDIEASDAAIPGPSVVHVDPEHAFTSAIAAMSRFDPVAMARGSIGRVKIHAGPKDGTEHSDVAVEGIAITGLANGRIERAAIGRIGVDVVAAAGRGRFAIADFEIHGVDSRPWRRLFAAREAVTSTGGGVWETTMVSARVGRTMLESADSSISIEAMRFGARSVRVDGPPLGPLVDRLVGDGGGVSAVEAAQFVLELFLATRNEGWSLDGLRLAGPDLDHATMARLVVGAFSGERLAELVIEGVDVAARKASLRLERAALADLRLPDGDDLRRAVQASAVGAEVDPSSVIPTLGHVSLRGFEVSEPGVPAIRLGAFTLDLAGHLRAIPTVVSASVEHFVVPVGLADAEGRRVLGDLGYDRIDFSAAARLAWRKASNEIAVETIELAVADLGRIDLTARLVGVPASLFLRPDTAGEIVAGIALAEAKATYTDASFVDRVIRAVARDEKTTPEKLRRRVVRGAEAAFAEIGDAARRRKLTEELRRFLARPTSITATARPNPPVPLVELSEQTDISPKLVERLDVTLGSGQ